MQSKIQNTFLGNYLQSSTSSSTLKRHQEAPHRDLLYLKTLPRTTKRLIQVKKRSESEARSVVSSIYIAFGSWISYQVEDLPPKHRVTLSGENLPDPISDFGDLPSRYSVPQRLLQNIQSCGYNAPTSIQAHGIPVLLEVSYLCLDQVVLNDSVGP